MSFKQNIPQHILDDIRARANIVDIVSETVTLKKSGKNLLGLCPFHNEKTPSFTVSPDKQIYYCFGCGAGGNVFRFLMTARHLGFMDAVRQLAERYGVPLPKSGEENDARNAEREQVLQLNRWAAEYFAEKLREPSGQPARAYIESRHFDPALVKQYQLGWAPAERRGLAAHLAKKSGCTQETLEKAGLVKFGEEGGDGYDRFRARVMFPLRDPHGNIIGFAGRVLDDQQPKYLNSPETALFRKGQNLFGLHEARPAIRRLNRVLVMEGYFDQMRAVQAGVQNAVATCGTALTPQQVTLLRNLAARATLVFDGDGAGQAAIDRGFELFLDQGMQVDVIPLPPGHDPDSYIREHGAESFLKLAETAVPYVEYFIRKIMREENIATVAGRVALVNRTIPLLSRVKNSVERSEHIRFLSETLGVEGGTLLQELKKALEQNRPRIQVREETPVSARQDAETYLLQLLFADPEAARLIRERVGPGDFRNPAHGRAAALAYQALDASPVLRPDALIDSVEDEEIKTLLARAGLSPIVFNNPVRAAADCIAQLRKQQTQTLIDRLRQDMLAAEKAGDNARARELYGKIRETQGSLNSMEYQTQT